MCANNILSGKCFDESCVIIDLQKTMDMCEVCKDAATYVKMVLSDKAIQVGV